MTSKKLLAQLDTLSNEEKANLVNVLTGYLGLSDGGERPLGMTEATHAQIREAIGQCIPLARHGVVDATREQMEAGHA